MSNHEQAVGEPMAMEVALILDEAIANASDQLGVNYPALIFPAGLQCAECDRLRGHSGLHMASMPAFTAAKASGVENIPEFQLAQSAYQEVEARMSALTHMIPQEV